MPCNDNGSNEKRITQRLVTKSNPSSDVGVSKHKVTVQEGDDLKILRDDEVRSNLHTLPKDWTGVRRIPKAHRRFNSNIYEKGGGKYAYLGIEENLRSGKNFFFDPTDDTISLSINVDGVPLT